MFVCGIDNKDSKKLRWILALANGSMAAGLMLRLFVPANGIISPAALHFLVGMLLGVSIALNFHVVWMRRRNRKNDLAR
jgi:hypothetical protein